VLPLLASVWVFFHPTKYVQSEFGAVWTWQLFFILFVGVCALWICLYAKRKIL